MGEGRVPAGWAMDPPPLWPLIRRPGHGGDEGGVQLVKTDAAEDLLRELVVRLPLDHRRHLEHNLWGGVDG